MTAAYCLLIATALCLTAAGARGATLSWVSAFRELQCGDEELNPTAPFGDFDDSMVSIVGVGGPAPREQSRASQRSSLQSGTITVASTIFGDSAMGASFFQVFFNLDEGSPYSLTGSISLLGSAGFACVSLLNLSDTSTPLVHEVIFAPPLIAESRDLSSSGRLEPGRYLMEAMVYGGGDGQVTTGGIDVAFSIPEPWPSSLIFAGVLLAALRRGRVLRTPL